MIVVIDFENQAFVSSELTAVKEEKENPDWTAILLSPIDIEYARTIARTMTERALSSLEKEEINSRLSALSKTQRFEFRQEIVQILLSTKNSCMAFEVVQNYDDWRILIFALTPRLAHNIIKLFVIFIKKNTISLCSLLCFSKISPKELLESVCLFIGKGNE